MLLCRKSSDYTSTFISVKGGSQEVAAIVANLNQPDFSDTFIGWLQTVHYYPKAFDFKYESISSILDIDVKTLFLYTGSTNGKLCKETISNKCEFGSTIQEFQEIWSRKLRALKLATTLYLKEKSGLTTTKFTIEKGDTECRFNILIYLSPYWKEIYSGGQEYRITFTLYRDESIQYSNILLLINSYRFKTYEEIYFTRREDFWLSRHKKERFSYQSAKQINEPLKLLNRNYINIYGLVLEYSESDATVTVVDMVNVLKVYSIETGCDFQAKYLNVSVNGTTQVLKPIIYLNYDGIEDDDDDYRRSIRSKRLINHHEDKLVMCQKLLKLLNWNAVSIKNYFPFWVKMWGKAVGILDYVDPIQSVMRTWDLPFAILPCQLKWSNKLMMVLPKDAAGKCLKFTAATEGEVFVVIASTPSDQKTWYTVHITTRGVILYRVSYIF